MGYSSWSKKVISTVWLDCECKQLVDVSENHMPPWNRLIAWFGNCWLFLKWSPSILPGRIWSWWWGRRSEHWEQDICSCWILIRSELAWHGYETHQRLCLPSWQVFYPSSTSLLLFHFHRISGSLLGTAIRSPCHHNKRTTAWRAQGLLNVEGNKAFFYLSILQKDIQLWNGHIIVQRSTVILNDCGYVQPWNNFFFFKLIWFNMIRVVPMRRVPLEAIGKESPVRIRKMVVEAYTKSLFNSTWSFESFRVCVYRLRKGGMRSVDGWVFCIG